MYLCLKATQYISGWTGAIRSRCRCERILDRCDARSTSVHYRMAWFSFRAVMPFVLQLCEWSGALK
jgi:hypothetical protein